MSRLPGFEQACKALGSRWAPGSTHMDKLKRIDEGEILFLVGKHTQQIGNIIRIQFKIEFFGKWEINQMGDAGGVRRHVASNPGGRCH